MIYLIIKVKVILTSLFQKMVSGKEEDDLAQMPNLGIISGQMGMKLSHSGELER